MINLKLKTNHSTADSIISDNDLTYLFSNDIKSRFETDVLTHLDALYTGALKLTGSTEDAESLVQKTLLNAFNNYVNFDGHNFKHWLINVLAITHCNLD